MVCDVDGTLTDGVVAYVNDNVEIKGFSIKDGLILKPMSKLGIDVLFLTGRQSEAVTRRAAELNATAIQGIEDKPPMLRKMLSERNIQPEQCAYIGDDLNDYAAMQLCGFKACPADAAAEIRALCDYVSPYGGGHGAVRDICEYLLKREGRYCELLRFYGIMTLADAPADDH